MSGPELVGRHPLDGRSLYFFHGHDVREWNADDLAGTMFTVLLAIDAGAHEEGDLLALVARLGRAGAACACAWGPGCADVHLMFDLDYVRAELRGESRVDPMTSWHEGEPLTEALFDALYVLFHPDATEAHEMPLVVGADRDEWERELRMWLGDVEAFTRYIEDLLEP